MDRLDMVDSISQLSSMKQIVNSSDKKSKDEIKFKHILREKLETLNIDKQ